MDTTTSAGTTSALYTYDAVSRLRTECYPVTGDVCVAKSPRNAYTYDKVGNRTSETSRTVVGTKATTVVTDYTYDAAYELLTESVGGDADGDEHVDAERRPGDVDHSCGYSDLHHGPHGRVDLAAARERFHSGLHPGRTGQSHVAHRRWTLDATWAWDDLSSLPMRIGEYDPAGTLTTGWLPDPTSSTGASLAQTSGGVSSWLLSDPFANTAASVSTTGGTVSGTRSMDAFGVQRTTATGSLADASVGFAGQYLDQATGLYDMRARDYDPSSGRFTATDPVAVPTGMPFVAGYSYAYNNPLMFSDPTGLLPLGDPRFRGKPTPLHGAVGSTVSGSSFSYTGYQETETVQYALITKSVDCGRDVTPALGGEQGEINDYCSGLLKAAATKNLRDRGGCVNNFLAWYAEHSDAFTASFAVAAWGQVSYMAPKLSAPEAGARTTATSTGITEGVAQTFKDGIYSTTTLQEDLVLTRYSGGRSQPIGQFWTRTTYSSPGRAQQYLALPPENTAVNTTTIRVPAGTTVYEGKAAAQKAWGENGGGNQVFIPYVDPAWIVP